MGSTFVENDGVTNHRPPLFFSHLTLLSSFSLLPFSPFPPLTCGPPSTMDLAWPRQGQSTCFIGFPNTTPVVEGRGSTAARSGPNHTDQDLQKHLVPPLGLHVGKLDSRERKSLSQNHITSIRVRSSDSLSFMLFLWSFLNPFHPSGWNHVVRLAVPALLSNVSPHQPGAKPYSLTRVLS